MTVEEVAGRFENARRGGAGFSARCPVHGDKSNSLSIGNGEKGVVLHCFVCGEENKENILAAAGLTFKDLMANGSNGHAGQPFTIAATYPYVDETGRDLYEVVRFVPKDFRVRRPDGNGGHAWNINGTRRVLYRLAEVIAAVRDGWTIYITEGEKDADEINALPDAGNIIATTNVGGAGKWHPEYSECLRGAPVVIVADKDEPGRKHAWAIAESLRGIAASVRIVEAREGKDAADHLAAGHVLEDFIAATIPAAVSAGPPPHDAEQIDPRVETWPEPPAETAYHGVIGDIVRALEPHTEADPVAVLAQLLVGLGNLIGGGPYFRVEGTQHRANEYVALVGRTAGGRKGTAWDQARRSLAAVDDEWARERVQGGLASGEGLIHAVRDRRIERRPVMEKGRPVDTTDVEMDAGITDKRLLDFEPELARVLRVMLREGSTLSTIIRQAWDSPVLRVMAKTAGAVATGAHVSIIAHVTGEELIRQLQDTEAASGFGNRFIWIAVQRSKLLPEGGDLDMLDLTPMLARLRDAVASARRTGEMKRDTDARDLWCAEYPRLTAGKPGLLGAMTSRAEAHVLRLSMIYALADESATIRRPHLEAAIALWDYSARSCAFIFGETLGDPTADDLLRALRAAPDGMARSEIREHFGRNKTSNEIGRALAVLARQSLAGCITEKPDGPGRPTERWRASGLVVDRP